METPEEKIALNTPVSVGRTELKNRLVMPPMATEKSTGGRVSQALVDYYDEKTKGGYIGLVIQEHSYVSPEGQASKNQVSVADDAAIEGLSRIVKAIHKNGTKVLLQLAHAGSAADGKITGLGTISASAIPNMRGITKGNGNQNFETIGKLAGEGESDIAREMSHADISNIVQKFAESAVRAKSASYDGCEIHSAHGYLLNQFYSPLTNHRTDKYSGHTIDGRICVHLEIIKAVRAAVGEDFILSLRLGACDYGVGGTTIQDSVYAAKKFAEAGLDMISISGGMCDYVNPYNSEPGWFSDTSQAIKREVAIPVLLTGGITKAEDAERLLTEQKADLIGVGRAILRDSGWARKAYGGCK